AGRTVTERPKESVMRRRRSWRGTIAGLAVLFGLGAGAVDAQSPAPQAQWVVAIGGEGESLDPPTRMLFTSEIDHQHIFDTRGGIEREDLKPVGLLAERWENVTPTTWRFHLRKGVKFHNGKPLEAEDVKYSIEQYLDKNNRRSVYARGIAKAEIKDANTVDV